MVPLAISFFCLHLNRQRQGRRVGQDKHGWLGDPHSQESSPESPGPWVRTQEASSCVFHSDGQASTGHGIPDTSWRLGSLLFKLFVTPSALSVAQRHCTILIVITAIRNLPFHPGDVHIIPIVIPRIFFDTSASSGTVLAAPRIEHPTVEVGVANWQHD